MCHGVLFNIVSILTSYFCHTLGPQRPLGPQVRKAKRPWGPFFGGPGAPGSPRSLGGPKYVISMNKVCTGKYQYLFILPAHGTICLLYLWYIVVVLLVTISILLEYCAYMCYTFETYTCCTYVAVLEVKLLMVSFKNIIYKAKHITTLLSSLQIQNHIFEA